MPSSRRYTGRNLSSRAIDLNDSMFWQCLPGLRAKFDLLKPVLYVQTPQNREGRRAAIILRAISVRGRFGRLALTVKGRHGRQYRRRAPDFLVPPMPVPSSVASVVPIATPASVVPMTVPEIRSIAIIRPIIRRIVSAPIDRIRRRHVDRARVVVGSGCPYRNAERRHNQRKTDD